MKQRPREMVLTPEQVEKYLREAARVVRETERELDRYFCLPASARLLVLRGRP